MLYHMKGLPYQRLHILLGLTLLKDLTYNKVRTLLGDLQNPIRTTWLRDLPYFTY